MRLLTDAPAHLVYRLYGSLPALEVERLREGRYRSLLRLRQQYEQARRSDDHPAYAEFQREKLLIDRFHFRQYDQLLDDCAAGPRLLEDTRIKEIVLNGWRYFHHRGTLTVHAVSVMSNHVHVVVSRPCGDPATLPELDLDKFLAHHKRYVATRINRLRDTRGARVFAEHNYVRFVRPGVLERVIRYVVNNPVAARLTHTPLQWPGTYLSPEYVRLFDERAA